MLELKTPSGKRHLLYDRDYASLSESMHRRFSAYLRERERSIFTLDIVCAVTNLATAYNSVVRAFFTWSYKMNVSCVCVAAIKKKFFR